MEVFLILFAEQVSAVFRAKHSLGLSPADVINLLTTNADSIFTIRAGLILATSWSGRSCYLGTVLAVPGVDPYIYNQQPLRDALESYSRNYSRVSIKKKIYCWGSKVEPGQVGFFPAAMLQVWYYQFPNVVIPGFTTGQNYTCIDVAIATSFQHRYFRQL